MRGRNTPSQQPGLEDRGDGGNDGGRPSGKSRTQWAGPCPALIQFGVARIVVPHTWGNFGIVVYLLFGHSASI